LSQYFHRDVYDKYVNFLFQIFVPEYYKEGFLAHIFFSVFTATTI